MDFIDHRSTAKFIFKTSATDEKARIDDSGNILTGKTSSNFSTAGAEVRNLGNIWATRDGGVPLALNRLSSEGTIAQFYKDGSSLGVIASVSSDFVIYSTISGHTGLRFGDGWIGSTNNAGTLQNGTVSLGTTAYKFADLHLSGNANIGGNATITGDLTVNGTTTTLNTATLDVEDKNITLNYGAGDTSSTADGAGITIQDAVDASNNATILWDATNDEFDFSHAINVPSLTTTGNVSFGDNDKAIFGAGSDVSIYSDGTNGLITSTANFTLDVAGDITLDADGADIKLLNGGTHWGSLYTNSTPNNLYLQNMVSDGDIYLSGFDGGSNISALILDMSAAGAATFNAGASFGGTVTTDGLEVEAAAPVLEISSTTLSSLASINFTSGGSDIDSKITHQGNTGVMTIDSGRNATWGGKIDFVTDTDTRMRISNNGDISFYDSAGSSQSLFWDASTKFLGLGSTTPQAKLDIVDTSADVQMRVYKNDGTKNTRVTLTADDSGAKIHYRDADNAGALRFNNNLGEVMRITANTTRVGIGTSAPAAPLEVQSSVSGNYVARFQNTNATTPYGVWIREPASAASAYPSFTVTDSSGSATRLRVDSGTGNVGIGTSSPDAPLHVEGTSGTQLVVEASSGNFAQIDFKIGGTQKGAIWTYEAEDLMGFFAPSGWGQNFYTNGTEAMRIDSSGRVGIGTSSPSAKLDVNGEVFVSPNTAGKNTFQLTTNASNDARLKMLSDTTTKVDIQANGTSYFNGGNVGIGTSSPVTFGANTHGLTINGTGHYQHLTLQNNGNSDFSLYTNGPNGTIINQESADPLHFNTDGSERMRLDASGNLMVGKTATAFGTAGVAVFGGGEIDITNTNEAPLFLNRLSSDGAIAQFYKDGTTVGSIGTEGGNLYIDGSAATGKTGIEFLGSAWYPRNDGANSDGAVDLGDSSNRFKDLYLSGKAQADTYQFAQNSSASGATEAIYRPTTGQIAFKTNSAERMRITNTGRLRINNTNAGWDSLGTLVVKQVADNIGIGIVDDNSSNTFQIRNNGGYAEMYYNVNLPIIFSQVGGERMRLDASGNLLVGTTTTNFNTAGTVLYGANGVQMVRSNAPPLNLNRTTSDGAIQEFFKDGTAVGSIQARGGDIVIGTGDTGIRFNDASNALQPHHATDVIDATIDLGLSSHRFKDLHLSGTAYTNALGVGTSSPAAPLHVVNNTAPRIEMGYGGGSNADHRIAWDSAGLVISADNSGQSSGASYLAMLVDGSEAMRLDASGNVGIGVTSPSSYYIDDLVVSAPNEGGITIASDSTSSGAYLAFADGTSGNTQYRGFFHYHHAGDFLRMATAGLERMRIDASGNLLLGKTSADNTTQGIRMLGSSGFMSVVRSSNTLAVFNRIDSDGTLINFRTNGTTRGSISISGSTTSYNTTSDQRAKENIVDAPSASDDIDAIKVRSFDFKADGSHQKYGMVAQELSTVAPEAVSVPDDAEEMQSVDYSKLVPMMLKEIQTLRARVAQLEGEN
jgi:hypothetical protein